MNNLTLNTFAIALGLAFSAGAMAEGISKTDYQVGKDQIAAEYKTAKAGCDSLSGNKSDICVTIAKSTQKVAIAELEASYKPSPETRYDARVAKAEADYAVANERCDDAAGNTKDVCVKEAKAAEVSAKADAEAQMKTADANARASGKSSQANATASKQSADARRDAAADKREAEHKVAKEKCEAFAGGTKDECLEQAKVQFGKL